MNTPLLVWRVVDWDERFETRGSRRRRGPLTKIAVSTDLNSGVSCRLLEASGGYLAYALWNILCCVAATGDRRGVLLKDGRVLDDHDLARLSRFPVELIQPALQLLASPQIGLLEQVPAHRALQLAKPLEPLVRKPRIQPLMKCPVCAADLTEYYQLNPLKPEIKVLGQRTADVRVGGEKAERERQVECPPVPKPSSPAPDSKPAPFVPPPQITDPAASATDIQAGPHDGVMKPRPSWLVPTEYIKAKQWEIDEVLRRFHSGEMPISDVFAYMDSHWFGKDGADEDDDDWDPEFVSGVPPPLKSG